MISLSARPFGAGAGASAVLPRLRGSTTLVRPPQGGPGSWAGGPSALQVDGRLYLAYRLRRPLGQGRGFCNVVAEVIGDQVVTLATLHRENFHAESLERPALVRTPEGRWRLYVSCATPGTKHWRVDMLEAGSPGALAQAVPLTVLPGDDRYAVKDPVLLHDGGRWHLWASVHPLARWDEADRMTTDYATSQDGVEWTWHGTVLRGQPDGWDRRGTRVTSVRVEGNQLVATYDGRSSAEQNWEETTGVARGVRSPAGLFGQLVPDAGSPLASPHGGLRYLTHADWPDGGTQLFYEVTRLDGAHELRAEFHGA
jgi:hypothetical protein